MVITATALASDKRRGTDQRIDWIQDLDVIEREKWLMREKDFQKKTQIVQAHLWPLMATDDTHKCRETEEVGQ